jgi:hypothetical protein
MEEEIYTEESNRVPGSFAADKEKEKMKEVRYSTVQVLTWILES